MSYISYVIITDKYYKSDDTKNQWYNFSSLVNKWDLQGTLYLTTNNNYYYIKNEIYKKTGLPIETMIEIGDLNNGDGYYKYDVKDYDYISTPFDEMKSYGGLYIYVDIYNSKTFYQKNNAILENERRIKN